MTVHEHEREASRTWVRPSPSQPFASCVAGPNHDLADWQWPRVQNMTGEKKTLGAKS